MAKERGLGRGDASLVQIIADMVGISLSAVCVPSDENISRPSGLRIGQFEDFISYWNNFNKMINAVCEYLLKVS
ncbi:unnamed protein product [Trichobilharzia regenti]|nr:unnamed protein product [Trichobilharzia regenti]